MTKAKKVVKKEVKKQTELDKVMSKVSEELGAAIKKNIRVIKSVKCTKEQLENFAQMEKASKELREIQEIFNKMRSQIWTKIEKDLKVKSYFKKGVRISIKFNEEKKTLEIVEDKNPTDMTLGGIIKI